MKTKSTTCWAWFGWLTPHEKRTQGITGHLPQLGASREELVRRRGKPAARHALVKVRITILP